MRHWVLMLVTAAMLSGAAVAQNPKDAEKKLQQVRGELKDVAGQRRQLEAQRRQAERELRAADQKVAGVGRSVAEVEQAIARERSALEALQAERAGLAKRAEAHRGELAALIRSAYRLGSHAPLKMLLSQDRVADGNRQLAYHRYLQRERSQRLAQLTGELQNLEQTEKQIQQRQRELDELREQHRRQAAALTAERRQRAHLVSELDRKYQDSSEREKALGQNVRALERVLANLQAAAAKAEAERRAAARRAATQRSTRERSEPARTARAPSRPAASAPAARVGGAGWPLSGNLLSRYGARLPDGRRSNGILIGAAAGTTVSAVADGSVVYSDWMTGYGMILIVDHGNGYMSLYAHNDALLRDVGARVKKGEAVAKVGSSGGQGLPALYFELRRNGQPVDPASWLQLR